MSDFRPFDGTSFVHRHRIQQQHTITPSHHHPPFHYHLISSSLQSTATNKVLGFLSSHHCCLVSKIMAIRRHRTHRSAETSKKTSATFWKVLPFFAFIMVNVAAFQRVALLHKRCTTSHQRGTIRLFAASSSEAERQAKYDQLIDASKLSLAPMVGR